MIVRKLYCLLLACVFHYVAIVDNAPAQSNFFIPLVGIGAWNEDTLWTSGHIPRTGETAYIHAGRTALLNSVSPEIINTLYVANINEPSVTDDGTLIVFGGANLRVAQSTYVGSGDPGSYGTIDQSAGSLRIDDALFMAFDSTHRADYNMSGGTLTVGNLWFRFGNGTMNQTGGIVNANNLVLGEGGSAETLALYNLSNGTLNVTGSANIGRGLGVDTFANSNGTFKITGTGEATFGDLIFGTNETDVVEVIDDGILRVRQSNYPTVEAMADIAAGNILGNELEVSTVNFSGLAYTQIISTGVTVSGDFDGDGDVDGRDFLVWQRDSSIGNIADWQNNYGTSPFAAAISIPEPSSLTMIAAFVVFALMRVRIRLSLSRSLAITASAVLVVFTLPSSAFAQLQLENLTDLEYGNFRTNFRVVTVPSTGQILNDSAPDLHQGNHDIYPVDPRIELPGDLRRVGIYWPHFLLAGEDPNDGEYFLTDKVESEGLIRQSLNVIQSSGKFIEYESVYTFRDLFTTSAHHWIWVDGENMFHRVQTNLEVNNPIKDVGAIWTELFNTPDAFETIAVQTRDDGMQFRSALGATDQHYLMEYRVGPDDWIATFNPQNDQAASVARAMLSSSSDIRRGDEVTPVWADATLFDNIELQVHRTTSPFGEGADLAPGTEFFMDNLLVTSPDKNDINWVNEAVARGKEWAAIIGPPIDAPAVAPRGATDAWFLPSSGNGNWSAASAWSDGVVPQLNDAVTIGDRRAATISSKVSTVRMLTVGNSFSGTLMIQPEAELFVTNRITIGSDSPNLATVTQTGGTLGTSGENPAMFLAYDQNDRAEYTITDGTLYASDIWFRFGIGTMNQKGGTVSALRLVLGEGGNASSQATYNLEQGTLIVYEQANIGKPPGAFDTSPYSNGRLDISGGTAIFGDLLFGDEETDLLQLSDMGTLLVLETNYSAADALADINGGHIQGANLYIGQAELNGRFYTRITPFEILGSQHASLVDVTSSELRQVPEPMTIVVCLGLLPLFLKRNIRRQCQLWR